MALGITKRGNEYASAVDGIDAPKAVWMAIAFSFAQRLVGEENPTLAAEQVLNEWHVLHANGIVLQKPYRTGRRRKTRFD